MGMSSADYNKLMKMADQVDAKEFLDFTIQYMRRSDSKKLSSIFTCDGKTDEEIRVTRKTYQDEGES